MSRPNINLNSNNGANNTLSLGLLNGDSGMAIIYYLLAKDTGNKDYKEKGLQLLNQISDNINSTKDLRFADGLAGIGWAVEWLVQNELLSDTNTDEVLEDVDDILYKSVVYSKDEYISLLDGTLGKIAYFLKRELSSNPNTHRFQRICLQECLVILTDDLADKITQGRLLTTIKLDHPISEPEALLRIIDLGTLVTMISGFPNINIQSVERTLYDVINYIELGLSKAVIDLASKAITNKERDYYHNILYLAICYFIAGKKHNHNFWQEQANGYIELLCNKIEEDNNNDISEYQLLKKLSLYTLLNIYMPNFQYKKELQMLNNYFQSKDLPLRLLNGWGAVVLASVSANKPDLVKDWHELFYIQ